MVTEEFTAVLICDNIIVREMPISDPGLTIKVARPTSSKSDWVSYPEVTAFLNELVQYDEFHYGTQKGNRIYYWKV